MAASQEAEAASTALAAVGGKSSLEDPGEAERLVDLRRHNRGMDVDSETTVGEDVAVPRSQLVGYVRALQSMARRHGVGVRIIAHAGDGNLHPTFWVAEANREQVAALNAALDESIDMALEMGGTITGEHGIGQYKLRWLPLEQAPEVRRLQSRIKVVFDPLGILNPGKAITDG